MKNKLALLSILILFFFSADSLSSTVVSTELSGLLIQVLYVIVIILLVAKVKNYSKDNIGVYVISLFLVFLLLTVFVNGDYSSGYIIQFVVLLAGYIIAKKIKLNVFVERYCQILFYLSIISVFLFSLFSFFPFLINLFPLTTNSEDTVYINLFFYVHYLNMFRNTGIFREPGMYMVYINFGVLLQYFYLKKINQKYLVTYIVALITTLSAGGFVVFAILSFIYLINSKKIKTAVQFLFMFVLLYVLIIYNFEFFESSFAKFDSSSKEYGSTFARISSISIPTAIFIDSPFFGVGLSNFKDLYEIYSRNLLGMTLKADGQSTNTLFNSLATYGFFFFLVLLASIYKFSTIFSKSSIVKIGIFISILLMLSNEDLRYSLFFTVLIFYGFKRYEK